MKVSQYLREDCCIIGLVAQDKEGVVREIAEKIAAGKSSKISEKDKFVTDVLEREALGSTGIGHGVAIPHARTDAVSGFVIGFGQAKDGVEFKALDGQKVNLVFLMGADPSELNFYLRVLAELSKLLMNASFRQDLLDAASPEEVVSVVKKYEV